MGPAGPGGESRYQIDSGDSDPATFFYYLRRAIAARVRSVRLVVMPHAANATAVQKDQALIELLAQGQRWFEQWLRGEVASLRAVAQSAGKRSAR